MNNICMRCGYTWSARSKKPLRCPHCKTTRWDKEVVKDVCKRCGAEWVQRGGEMPKYRSPASVGIPCSVILSASRNISSEYPDGSATRPSGG